MLYAITAALAFNAPISKVVDSKFAVAGKGLREPTHPPKSTSRRASTRRKIQTW